ncbi:Calcium/calmodulin-dependent serine/threonine-protein kinase 1 [Triticum urartu]|uniref:Calcium/calmodulin-dependent serine/threonine-protein kinase 1 n=1 Tax=Triticum urartu TaxID=4572 RepID=M7YVI9_TRIUA|nr:Calcium/calmodulin-dependent serine/threonine-protein kinase 1 [Triticum urartu]
MECKSHSGPEDGDGGRGLDKGFGFNKGFAAKYDLGDEVGRGHFGYTCAARIRKGARKGDAVAVKLIPKAKVMTCPQPLQTLELGSLHWFF